MKLIKKNEYTHIGLPFDGGNHNEIISFLGFAMVLTSTFSFTKREVPNVKFDLGNLGILEPGDVRTGEQSSAGISGVMVICDTSIEDLF